VLKFLDRDQPPWRFISCQSRPVCVALLPEHRTLFVCGNKDCFLLKNLQTPESEPIVKNAHVFAQKEGAPAGARMMFSLRTPALQRSLRLFLTLNLFKRDENQGSSRRKYAENDEAQSTQSQALVILNIRRPAE